MLVANCIGGFDEFTYSQITFFEVFIEDEHQGSDQYSIGEKCLGSAVEPALIGSTSVERIVQIFPILFNARVLRRHQHSDASINARSDVVEVCVGHGEMVQMLVIHHGATS